MISIIIPAYNSGKTIARCLESIFNQTFKDFEIIVVNDGSSDNTLKAIEGFDCKVINQENQGANFARNRGFKQAKGEYLLFCDSDLVLENDALEQMSDALKNNPKASYAYCSFKFGWKKFKLWDFDPWKLKQMPYIHTTSLIRMEHFPGFDENIKRLQDWDLWLTMLEQGHSGVWIPRVLFKTINTRGTMSNWLPSLAYKLLFLNSVKKYNKAVEIIKKKHKIVW